MRLAAGGSGVFAVVDQRAKRAIEFDFSVPGAQHLASAAGNALLHNNYHFPLSSIVMSVASGPWGREPKTSNRLVYIALILPIISTLLLVITSNYWAAVLIATGMVIATSILVMIDADRHGEIDQYGRQREGGLTLLIGMLLIWAIVFPYAFFRRRAFVSPNLGWVSVLVTIFAIAIPILRIATHTVTLPECTSAEVIETLEKAVRSTAIGHRLRSIEGHRELNFNESEGIRYGVCLVHLDTEEFTTKYNVRWRNRQRHEFEVRIEPSELPSCRSPEVVQLLDSLIRGTPLGRQVTEISGIRETRYDRVKQLRFGECVAHTPQGDTPFIFVMKWLDQDQGQFQVKVLPAESAPVGL